MNRREFLEASGGTLLVGASCTYAVRLFTSMPTTTSPAEDAPAAKKMGMVIDVNRCQHGCEECLRACEDENNVARHGDKRWDVHWIKKVTVREKHNEEDRGKPVVMLCNHCDEPPCAQVCPVQATYKRPDGIVIVDYHRCIGCRYCVVACPYNARYFNFKEREGWPNKGYPRRTHGVAEACTLCAHRLDVGQEPACVLRCREIGANAITVGDLNDPESGVSQLLAENTVRRIRDDLGTEPKVHYIGL